MIACALLAACGGGQGTDPALKAGLSAPREGEELAGTTKPLAWDSVSGARAYRLQVGTRTGDADVLDSGELAPSTTIYLLPGDAPRHVTLFARLSYLTDGRWRTGPEVRFTISSTPSNLTRPLAQERLARVAETLSWRPVSGAEGYYLWVGRSPGGRDVINSGEFAATATQYAHPTQLPRGRTLYARLWRKVAGQWIYDEDVSFEVAAVPGELTHPWREDRIALDASASAVTFRWAPIVDAQKYYLYVGTSPGAKDVVDTGELGSSTTQRTIHLRGPLDTPLHARLYYLSAEQWRYVDDVPFSFVAGAATIVAPKMGEVMYDSGLNVEWTPHPAASAYEVSVGREPGAADIWRSQPLSATTVAQAVPSVPHGEPLYVRVRSQVDGEWRHYRDHLVTALAAPPLPKLLEPTASNPRLAGTQPVVWTDLPGARGYRLQLGSAPGLSDIDDSGTIVVTRRFVANLALNQRVFGRLAALVDGAWIETDFEFTVVDDGNGATAFDDIASSLTVQARSMGTHTNEVKAESLLETLVAKRYADCNDYANALIELLWQANMPFPYRKRGTCLISNSYDCHTLVEVMTTDGEWGIYDPTFAASPVDAVSGKLLSVADLSDAIRNSGTQQIGFTHFSDRSQELLNTYYLDYALLYVHPEPVEGTSSGSNAAEISVLHHYDRINSVEGQYGPYALRCPDGQSSVSTKVDGTWRTLRCQGIDRLTPTVVASDIDAVDAHGLGAEVFSPRRYTTGVDQP